MQPYQEEYIANLRQIAALTQRETPGQTSFEAYCAQLHKIGALVEQIAKRSMELLRGHLFPVLDELFQADAATVGELGRKGVPPPALQLRHRRGEHDGGGGGCGGHGHGGLCLLLRHVRRRPGL